MSDLKQNLGINQYINPLCSKRKPMKKVRLLLLMAAILVPVLPAFAQQVVKGVVLSEEDGLPVPGASVVVKGSTKMGTVTDIDGNFSLSVPESAKTLVVSFLGMLDQEVAVAPNLKIVLKSDTEMLEQVVVTDRKSVV